MSSRFNQIIFGHVLLLAFWINWENALAQAPAADSPVILTNAAQVRALTPAEASQRLPVRIRGVVINKEGGFRSSFFSIVDGNVGIYCQMAAGLVANFARGDLIEVGGVSNPGKFAPYLDAHAVRNLGKGMIPEPRVVNRDELLSGQLDAQWIEVSGVVRRVKSVGNGLDLEADMETGGGRMLVHVSGGRRAIPVDSTVRLRGVCYYQFNKTRQALSPYLSVPAANLVFVSALAATNLDTLPVCSVENLMQFSPVQSYVHRVRVRGAVIHSQPGEDFWIRDGERGLHVVCDGKEPLEAGAEVDVFGFLSRGEYGPMLEDAVFRKTAKTLPVPPIHLMKAAEALDHDSDLVECEAVIQEQWPALDGCRLKLSDGITEFPAVLRLTNHNEFPTHWLPGARVRVAGICAVGFLTKPLDPGTLEPQHFQILLRSPADVVVLQRPSWWTAEHVAWLLGAAALMLVLAVAIIVWTGRRHLREQAIERMKSEAEFSAVMNERNRMAREFHDTLAQGLGAISLQLEVAKRQLPADSNAQKPLAEAGTQTRTSLDEVRNAIWNMRSQVLETGDLASALNGVLHVLTDRHQLQAELKVIGEPKRFAPVVENNLLRIGQEAIANAVKHAQAKRIEVVLTFERRQFELCVSDDGRGFDPSHPPASEGGFGLVGMRERVTELNGALNVSGAPGKGCIVKLTLPLSIS